MSQNKNYLIFYKFYNYSLYYIKIYIHYKLNMQKLYLISRITDFFKRFHFNKSSINVQKRVKIHKLNNILYKN